MLFYSAYETLSQQLRDSLDCKHCYANINVLAYLLNEKILTLVFQEQFVFVHDAVVAMFLRQLDLMLEHSDYYNFPAVQPTVRFHCVYLFLNHIVNIIIRIFL